MNNEAYDSGIIVIGNDACCKVVDRGTIKLKMFNGMVRKLKDVKHVPELKRNLISLGMLNKMGCSVRLESSTLKVMKWLMVLMKRNMNIGMYVL